MMMAKAEAKPLSAFPNVTGSGQPEEYWKPKGTASASHLQMIKSRSIIIDLFETFN